MLEVVSYNGFTNTPSGSTGEPINSFTSVYPLQIRLELDSTFLVDGVLVPPNIIPDIKNNDGKFLYTDGRTFYWRDVVINSYSISELDAFFAGITPIAGYNNSFWDAAYAHSVKTTGTVHGLSISALQSIIASNHSALTLGTPNGLSLVAQQLSMDKASSTTTGSLLATDWVIFNNKLAANTPIAPATKSKITYDSKGLVTAGDVLTASEVPITPFGGISSTNVQGAINELDTEKASSSSLTTLTWLTAYNDDIAGVKDNSNRIFTISDSYLPGSPRVYLNGFRVQKGSLGDYYESDVNEITFNYPITSEELLLIDYIKI